MEFFCVCKMLKIQYLVSYLDDLPMIEDQELPFFSGL